MVGRNIQLQSTWVGRGCHVTPCVTEVAYVFVHSSLSPTVDLALTRTTVQRQHILNVGGTKKTKHNDVISEI